MKEASKICVQFKVMGFAGIRSKCELGG